MRGKRLIRLLASALLFSCLLSGYGGRGEAASPAPVRNRVRIGLFYGDEAMQAANLLNYVGSGYQFGYFDANLNFVPLGETGVEAITMLKDWNMYLQDGAYYDEQPAAYSGIVGCYHIRLPGTYLNFSEASTAAALYSDAFVGYYNGSYAVCVGSYTSYGAAESDMYARALSGEIMTGSAYCVTVVETGSTHILFEFDAGSSAALGVMPKADASGAKPETWFRYYRYYGGFRYERLSGGNMTVVNILDLEDYIKGVVPYEMSTDWPIEALKAQALSARTYAATHFNYHRSYNFDLCNTTDCQAYHGTNSAGQNSDLAVDSTAGQFIRYNGELCETFYSSSDGGATENSENVFYEALPYLRGVIDPYEEGVETGYSDWSFTYTADDITWILQAKGYNCAQIVSVTPTYTDVGNVYSLRFTDANGRNFTFSRYDAQGILYSPTLGKYTYSQRFTIVDGYGNGGNSGTTLYVNGEPVQDASALYAAGGDRTTRALGAPEQITVLTGSGSETVQVSGGGGETLTGGVYTVHGSGWGHNVGMSQYGAYGMARRGFTYDQIIKFYYTGVTIG